MHFPCQTVCFSTTPCHHKDLLLTIGRGILDLRSHLTEEQFQRVLNFQYMKSEAEVQDFAGWIASLGIKKLSGVFVQVRSRILMLIFGRLVGT